jgi:hypothetical protein
MLPNNLALQVFYGTIPVIALVLVGAWSSNKRLGEIARRLDAIEAIVARIAAR